MREDGREGALWGELGRTCVGEPGTAALGNTAAGVRIPRIPRMRALAREGTGASKKGHWEVKMVQL